MAQKLIAQGILEDLKRANAKEGESTRKDLTRQNGQILAISMIKFKNILKGIFDEPTKKELDAIWKRWDAFLRDPGRMVKVSKERQKELDEVIPTLPRRRGTHYYKISTYDAVRKQKTGTGKLGDIIKEELLTRPATEEQLGKIGGAPGTDTEMQGVQLGHEQEGVGIATSGVAAKQAEAKYRNALGLGDDHNVMTHIYNYYDELGITIDHTQVVTATGGIDKKYIPIVFWQKAKTNQEMAQLERAAFERLEKELTKDMATMSGSTPLDVAVSQVIFNEVAPKKRKNTKTTGDKKRRVSDHSSATEKARTTQKRAIPLVRDSGIDARSVSKLRKKKKGNAVVPGNPMSLVALINKTLASTVRKNMGPPGLMSRSGQFANSVKVLDASRTAQGFLSFGYNYAKDPYQVFEVGKGTAPWATVHRDPRKVIDRSIREIAAELALGRFYTRRL